MNKNSMLAGYVLLLTVGALVLMFVGWIVISRYRRYIYDDSTTEAFTLEDLRRMRERGQINEVEYQSMRGAMISELRTSSPGKAPKK